MPIYEYKCQGCGKISELRVPIDSFKKAFTCDVCGRPMEKLISVPSISTGKQESVKTRCCGRTERCSSEEHCCGHSGVKMGSQK